MKAFIDKIFYQWSRPRWQPRTLNLDRHIEHIAGGMAIAFLRLLVWIGYGWHMNIALTYEQLFRWVESSVFFALVVAFIIEGGTVLVKRLISKKAFDENWRDSIFDFVQYCCVVVFLFVVYWQWGLVGLLFLLWLACYFTLLLWGW